MLTAIGRCWSHLHQNCPNRHRHTGVLSSLGCHHHRKEDVVPHEHQEKKISSFSCPNILRISSNSLKDCGLLGHGITPVPVPRWLCIGSDWAQPTSMVECRTVLQK